MKQLLFLLLSIGFFLFLEAKENILDYKGEPSDFLTFSPDFPIEMNALNEKMIQEKKKSLFFSNMEIEQKKSLPWQRLFLGIFAVTALLILRYFPRNIEKKVLENKKTAQENAKIQLKKLKLKPISTEEYYRELSLIFRNFIERTYGIKASKETTEELLMEIEKNHNFAFLRNKNLDLFLKFSDLAKFAGASATWEEQQIAYKNVLELIEKGDEK